MSETYRDPVAQLLTLGDPRQERRMASEWRDYPALGLAAEHVPELVRMALDEDLHWAGSESAEVWAPLHAWRRFLLRLFGARIGPNARIYPSCKIWAPWNLALDEWACLGPDVDCYSVDTIHLGGHCTVSQYSFLCGAGHDISDPHMRLVTGPIRVGAGAWVCAGAFVAAGVTIGDGAVVAARAVVLKDVAPWTVVGGNPAAFIKRRSLTGQTAPPDGAS